MSCQSFWFKYAPGGAESSLQVSRICPHRNRCTFWPKLTQVCSASTHSTAHININIKINRSSTYDNKNINKIIKTTLLSIELVSSTTRVTSFKSQEEELQKDKALIRPENDKRYCLQLGDLAKVTPYFTIYLAELHLNSRKNTEKGSLHDRM